MKFGRLLVCLFLGLATNAAIAGVLKDIRLWQDEREVRLIFELDHTTNWQDQALSSPHRIVIDLQNTASGQITLPSLSGSPIKRIRRGMHGKNLRVVLDMQSKLPYRLERLPSAGIYGPRVLVRITTSNTPKVEPADPPVLLPSPITASRNIRIVIDAGHGGEDPGAVARGKVYEKKITLLLAKALQKEFNKMSGYEAFLTRSKDYFVPLRGRTERARKNQADFFISLHADSFTSSRPRGASVFALSRKGATSERGRVLARKENQSDLVAGFNAKQADVKATLLDFMMDGTISASKSAGALVVQELSKVTIMHGNRVEQAGFVVLKNPNLPSLLIETGFLSNPKDRKNLLSASHRSKLVKAIAKGVRRYFALNPVRGTHAWNKIHGVTEQTYVVRPGDSLSILAQKFGSTVALIKQRNGLKSGIIYAGQKLVIPGR